ncbi:MAG: phosphatidylserine/phosphatidylglycerophosphate/cardiolipin synthase family protein [Sphingopyxis sp.]|nr:phosphatidylserine/phosphatidylglycerophosphate/cardiolipin synthase family protein [Sphingopyxis sp.]
MTSSAPANAVTAEPPTPEAATVAGHNLALIPSGPDRLARFLQEIDTAQQSIRILTYTFGDDAAGHAIIAALTDAVRRGVCVTMLIDSFGSNEVSDAMFDALRSAGATVRWFGTRWTPRYLIRNHQKLAVFDDTIVITGGFNLAEPYFAPASDVEGWRDLGLRLTGPQVAEAVRWFDGLAQWMEAKRPRFRDLRRLIRQWQPADGPVSWLIGGPTARLSPWRLCLSRHLIGAKRLDVSVPYFSPTSRILRRMAMVAKHGGEARIILPARSDIAATVAAARVHYGFLLKRGVSVAEFQPSWLHNKIIVIDDCVFIGSSNLDRRSLYINMEIMLRVEDAEFAATVRSLLDSQQAQSQMIDLALHRKRRTWISRLRGAVALLMVSTLDYALTRRLAWGSHRDET